MAETNIQWTQSDDGTPGKVWNPVRGCSRVSSGCERCYAERQAHRFSGSGLPYEGLTVSGSKGPRWSGKITLVPEVLDQPLRWRKPRRIFVNSMSDLFHEDVPDEFIARAWQVMGAAPEHAYQILTKRPERMRSWVGRWYAGEIAEPYEARPVAGYPGYSVTTHGQVLGKRADTSGGLSPDAGEQGHLRVTMHREGSPKSGERESVHRLVLTAFARPARAGEQACHRNGDPSDNRISNLYWGSQETNWGDRVRHGRGRSYSKLTEEEIATIRRRCAAGEPAYRVAKDYPVSDTQIRNIVSGRQWSMPPPAISACAPARVVLSSVWLGVSCEDQATADERIPILLQTPAAVRFVSAEPLLGQIDLGNASGLPVYREADKVTETCGATGRVLRSRTGRGWCRHDGNTHPWLDWVIVGGESGPGARPCDVGAVRSIVEQCAAAGVSCFVKQLGARPYLDVIDHESEDDVSSWFGGARVRWNDSWEAWLPRLLSRSGSDPSEWPEDLRVRQFPGQAEDSAP